LDKDKGFLSLGFLLKKQTFSGSKTEK